jgi:hypothetical protein
VWTRKGANHKEPASERAIISHLAVGLLNSVFGLIGKTVAAFQESELQPMKSTQFEQAGPDLEKLVAQSLKLVPPSEAPLLAWPVVCGSAVAERTRALNFQQGILLIEVADSGWKTELQALAPRYLASINRYTSDQVRRIEFVVARPSRDNHPHWRNP